jgi:hypothetical protein
VGREENSPKTFRSHKTTTMTTTAFRIDLMDPAMGMKLFTSQSRTPTTIRVISMLSKGMMGYLSVFKGKSAGLPGGAERLFVFSPRNQARRAKHNIAGLPLDNMLMQVKSGVCSIWNTFVLFLRRIQEFRREEALCSLIDVMCPPRRPANPWPAIRVCNFDHLREQY